MVTKELSPSASHSDWLPRTLTVAEVAFASLLTCVLWQGFKRFTALGQMEVSSGFNFSPGIVTILVAAGLFLVRRRSLEDYGVSLRNWLGHLKTGVVLTLILMLVGLLVRLSFVEFHGSLNSIYGSSRSPYLFDAAMAVFFLALLPLILKFAQRVAACLPTPIAVLALLSLWMMPLVCASVLHLPLIHISFVTLGLIVTTGFGEELLYWGYVLPRLNEVWGRSYSYGGIRFGWGLAITALIFGLIHALNGVDFLHGHFNLNWGWGLAALLAGVAHGLLREGTGSIIPGAVLHGINDAWLLVVLPAILG